MTLFRPPTHRILDFITVITFAAAPFALALTGPAAWLAWMLAGVHLFMTVATKFPGRTERPVPLRLHGHVESLVGVVLLILPFILGWAGTARAFYLAAGIVILVVRATSDYHGAARAG